MLQWFSDNVITLSPKGCKTKGYKREARVHNIAGKYSWYPVELRACSGSIGGVSRGWWEYPRELRPRDWGLTRCGKRTRTQGPAHAPQIGNPPGGLTRPFREEGVRQRAGKQTSCVWECTASTVEQAAGGPTTTWGSSGPGADLRGRACGGHGLQQWSSGRGHHGYAWPCLTFELDGIMPNMNFTM